MSKLTLCNYCSLKYMEERAKERGATVILRIDEYGWTEARYSDREVPSAWFHTLTNRCVC